MDISDILAIWGALTGTAGTGIAWYAVRLSRKSQQSKVILDKVLIEKIEKGAYGAAIKVSIKIENAGLVPTEVTEFFLDLGPSLNKQYQNTDNESATGFLKFNHSFPIGGNFNNEIVRKPTHNASFRILPGSHVGPVNLNCHIMYESEDTGQHSDFLNKLLAGNKFSIFVKTTGGKLAEFSGKTLNWETIIQKENKK
jgi:hypothetical protein